MTYAIIFLPSLGALVSCSKDATATVDGCHGPSKLWGCAPPGRGPAASRARTHGHRRAFPETIVVGPRGTWGLRGGNFERLFATWRKGQKCGLCWVVDAI